MQWKQLRKLRRLLPLALLVFILFNSYFGIWSIIAVKADYVEISPGKIPPTEIHPTEKDLYLGNSSFQVQLEYPKSIILQQTTGDLLFNVTITSDKGNSRRTIALYIPPEFKINRDRRYVWSSITNDYRYISLSTLSDRDPIAPNWYRILVSNGISRISIGSHFIRVFNVTAPSIVGRYFFKVFIDGASIGAKNFPTIVVSADINPAYISGTVLDGSRDLSKYGRPIQLEGSQGGRVIAEGFTPQGRKVVAQAFFNSSALVNYTLYGLAPGTYYLTASAMGYSNTTRPDPVRVLAGQSLTDVSIFAFPSPKLKGTVWSKCGGMSQPWGPVAVQVGPGSGAALAYVGTGPFPGHDLIYALRGSGTSDFFRYDVTVDKWEARRSPPGSVGLGGSLAFDDIQYIYALQGGGSNTFWRYTVADDVWQAMPTTPSFVGDGGALAFDGSIYALGGGGTKNFWRYDRGDPDDPTTDTWNLLSPTPSEVGPGGSLTFNRNNGKFYAFGGNGVPAFWSYDKSTDTWTDLTASIPPPATSGASLAFNQNGLIYALVGGGVLFSSYTPGTPGSWNALLNIIAVGPGGSLTFDRDNGRLYALVGGGNPSVFYYSPIPNVWTGVTSFPHLVPRPITIEILDSLGQSERLLQNFTDPDSDRFDFTYDGSIDLDGHIPQDGSGYIAGIAGGLHIVRVWVNQYVQRDAIQLPGTATTITGVQVRLPNQEGLTGMQLSVHRAGRAEVLVHFKDFAQLKKETPVESARTVTVALYDLNLVVWAQNSTRVPARSNSSLVTLTGPLGTARDYGLPMGTYVIGVTVNGFYQPSDAFITIGDCNARSQASLEVARTGSLNVTICSVNSQKPPMLKKWGYPGATIRMEVRDYYGTKVFASNSTRQGPSPNPFSPQSPFNASVMLSVTGLRTGTYSIYVFTYGYIQPTRYYALVTDGSMSDTTVNVVQGGTLEVTIVLKKQDILTTIDTYPISKSRVPIRIQVLDAYNQFVAANASYVSPKSSMFRFQQLAGFSSYAGSYYERRWVNYYDTTNGALQRDYGLGAGSYTLIVYLPGFLQSETVTAVLPKDGNASVIFHLDRLAHFSGYVSSFDMYDKSVRLNWATVNAIGQKTHDFTPTLDGSFDMWLEKGRYLVTWSLSGYQLSVRDVYLPNGSDVQIDLQLTPLKS
jgi:hypothetical protein